MSNLNKIKLKQIDADFSGLVGQYGSGYFATTGAINAISGSILNSANLVYTTGNQQISGIKTFTSGVKIIINSNAISTLHVSSGRVGINTETPQYSLDVNGSCNFSQIPKVNGTGLILDRQANSIYVNNNTSNGTKYLLFSTGSNSGYKDIFLNSNIRADLSSSSITASSFVGAFSGNSLNGTSSTNLNIGVFASHDVINFNFPAGTSNGYVMNSGSFHANPATGNSITSRNLGTTNSRWQNIFAGTTTIGSSDRNLKTEISEIPDEWLDAWQEVDYVRYKFKDAVAQKGASEARWHVGHIAQDIYEKFQNHGLNALEIGMLCYDKWDESIDQNGNIIPSGEIWSIRADECQFMEMALTRRSIKRLQSEMLI